MISRCGATTRRGGTCRRRVRADGDRCWRHRAAEGDGVARDAPLRAQLTALEASLEASIGEVVGGLLEWQRYVAGVLAEMAQGGEPPSPRFMQVLELYSRNASRLGRLLRDQRALDGQAGDGYSRALERALDELRDELGWDV